MIRLLAIALERLGHAAHVIHDAVTDDRRFDYDAHYGRERKERARRIKTLARIYNA